MKKLNIILPLALLLGNLLALGIENPRPWIRSEMKRLGFDTATIAPDIGGVYKVQVTGFKPSGSVLSLPGKFRSFTLYVKPVKGKLFIDQEKLVNEHYTASGKSIPKGSSIVPSKLFRKYLRTSDLELSQMNTALSSAKDYKMRGRIKIANVLSKSRIVESLINDCSVPNPATDIPKMRATLNRLGLQTGNIQLVKGRIYKINITGASPEAKLEFVSGKFKPFVLEGMFVKGKLCIDPKSWATGFSSYLDETYGELEPANDLEIDEKIPFFIISEVSDYPYRTCDLRCPCYVENADRAKKFAKKRYEFLKNVLSEVERMRDFVQNRCERDNLTDSDKASLQNSLIRLVDQAERQKDEFDKYIEDIERFIEEYNECKTNESISP